MYFYNMTIYVKYLSISVIFVSLYSPIISFIYIKSYLNRFLSLISKTIDSKLNNHDKFARY